MIASAHAEPHFEGRVGLGARLSSTSRANMVTDTSWAERVAVDGLLGLRFGSFVIGLHGGLASPQQFLAASHTEDETEASAETAVYPLDLGLGFELDTGVGPWLGGWVGATLAVKLASSSATHIHTYEYEQHIDSASWSERSSGLAYGVSVGFDVPKTAAGRFGVFLAVESQELGGMGFRENSGRPRFTAEQLTTRSLTLGLTYTR